VSRVAVSVLAFLIGLPRLAAIAVLIAYRKVVSPLYGQVCRFYPSCSAYALEAVTVHGFVKGSWLASRRVARCHPWNDGGVDHVPEGSRIFPPGKIPPIVVLNHPVIPVDDESRPAA
jgi:putative membrane protein insertion efficiency factor